MKEGLKIIPVGRVDEVLAHALTQKLTPIEWSEPVAPPPAADVEGGESVVTH